MKKKESGDGRRIIRAEREIQQAIAKFLLNGFKRPLPGLVTVAHVKMPADLRSAKVYISVLGTDKEKEQVVSILTGRAFEVQNFIGREMKMRFCPKLTFYPDETTEKVLKIEKILADLKQEQAVGAIPELNLQPNLSVVSDDDNDE